MRSGRLRWEAKLERLGDRLRVPGGVASSCLSCGAGGVYLPETTDKRCRVCGFTSLFRRCPRCGCIVQFSPDAGHPRVKQWHCFTCRQVTPRRRWKPAAMGDAIVNQSWVDLYDWLGLDLARIESDPERRRLDGTILSAEGISGITSGGVTVFFDTAIATLLMGDIRNPRPIPYRDITGLAFGGRGVVTTTVGVTWQGGGFGLGGALKGMAMAQALNLLTRRTRHSVESVVDFRWEGGQVILVNNVYLPQQLAYFLAPVVARIEAEHARRAAPPAPGQPPPPPAPPAATAATPPPDQPDQPDLAEQLQKLVALRDAGALTEEEFAAAKARLIKTPGQ